MSVALVIVIVIIFLFLAYYAFDSSTPATTASSPSTTTNASSAVLLADNSTCSAATDCQGGHCVFGRCTSAVSGASACSATVACPTPANQYCDNGVCVNMQAAADCNPGCAPGYLCSDSKCISANYSVNTCAGKTCTTSGDVCTNAGCQSNLYKCSSNDNCTKGLTGPDSVCNTHGYCSCSYDIPVASGYACFTGSPVLLALLQPKNNTYSGQWDILNGYVSDGTNYLCGGKICSGYQTCVKGVCT